MDEIYETEVWKKLEKHALFKSKFDEIMAKCAYFVNKKDINVEIAGNKLVISYHSDVRNRELNCQFVRDTKYELYIDQNNGLIVNEYSGSLRSNYGYDFDNTVGGVLDTHYSYEGYDEDGIELLYQAYRDSIDVNKEKFDSYKNGFLNAVLDDYNPNLDSPNNNMYLCALSIGNDAMYTRQKRTKNNLGIVVNSACRFDKLGKVIEPKEEYYFNTFITGNKALNPFKISFTRNYPFATVDDKKAMHFNELYTNSGLTSLNYREVADERFLKELVEERELNGKHVSKDVIDKYDVIIDRLKTKNNMKERTR